MSATRISIHLISVALLLLWSAVLLYFYATGRIAQYLPGDGIFRPMVLVSGIGLAVLALFNLLTAGAEDAGCEGHDHGGHDHNHGHDDCCHGHSHAKTSPCGHNHPHHAHEGPCDHEHPHHAHEGPCDHEHHHEHEDHAPGCHGHDHAEKPASCGHEHHAHEGCGHEHHHAGGHSHGHGLLEESSWPGRVTAILILAAPITWAAFQTPDNYSANAVINKGLYNPNYNSTANADKFSLRTDTTSAAAKPATAEAPTPAATASAPQTAAAADGKQPQSYGSFTLEDLKQQVPQSKEGNFMLDVPEIYYTGGDIEVQTVLTGQPVETIAQVLPEKVKNDDGRRLRIFRMLVQCCAADARPYSVPVEFEQKAPDFKDMTWVKVTGIVSYEKDGSQTVPVLKATSIEETTAPENTMIY
ncbi:MAG TPA: hypothetical protein DIT13_06380 [Verrucomicrobiales bacterium]|nr:hypothetical protein [Verrucomicrobiales bacterium]HRJ06983.1 hypothetical protein [Prosthecobacter sp.]HRK13091.1 hypothetical protein [Prosthecobacter sp.]